MKNLETDLHYTSGTCQRHRVRVRGIAKHSDYGAHASAHSVILVCWLHSCKVRFQKGQGHSSDTVKTT